MSLMIRRTLVLLSVGLIAAGCGYNPKKSDVDIPAPGFKGTVECLYPDAGCHAFSGTWTDSWAAGRHGNTDDLPAFALSEQSCVDCHNAVEDDRNDGAFLFTAGALLGPPDRPIAGCEVCHGAGMEHYAYVHSGPGDTAPAVVHPSYDPAFGDTHYLPAMSTVVAAAFPNAWHLTSCGPCHSPDHHAGGSSFGDLLTYQSPEWRGGDGPGLLFEDGHSDSLVVETDQGFMTSAVRGVPCAACHTVEGFVTFFAMADTSWASSQTVIDRLVLETGDADLDDPDSLPGKASLSQVSCVSCHPSHEPGVLVRSTSGALTGTDREAELCLACHNGRGLNADTGSGQIDTLALEVPRHPQRELFLGFNDPAADGLRGVEDLPGFFGTDSAHAGTVNVPEGCAGCHYLLVSDVNITGFPLKATTGHTFAPRLENCLSGYGLGGCHADTDFLLSDGSTASFEDSTLASFDMGSVYYSGPAHPGMDYDGDGSVEPFQTEISGMLSDLKSELKGAGVEFDDRRGVFDLTQMASRTATERAAAYNYDFVVEDGSLGMHNPIYIVNLLASSISALP